MKIKIIFIGVFLIGLAGIFSCNENKKNTIENPEVKIKLDVFHLEEEFFAAKSVERIDSILFENSDVLELYFNTPKAQRKSLANALFNIYQNKDFKDFYSQSKQKDFFGTNQWQIQLENAFNKLVQLYPNIPAPTIKTVFTGFGGAGQFPAQHLVVSDTLIIIGLDYFMGSKGKYIAPELYDYQVKRLEPNGLAGQILLQYSSLVNKHQDANRTLLSDIIWYGKALYFTKNLIPEIPDSTLFGYTSKELSEVNQFQNQIWEHFIGNSLLYKSDSYTKTKYVGERPKTPEIGPSCPGSIGRWLGYTIVDHYQKNNTGKKLSDLMKMDDAQKILQESGYRGKSEENK
ncbi:hypothetical protein EOJ36_08705 [Sandaracinomonas limnophila]|uniref:Uncharacterized protein n=1 Tax=Sandaracinomonas limnophila TaxID=1862386 RepID=A0A437PS34_9BACT|nr:hypothetical protein [Sandaracinomonas limnophila]RVU25075.1 hypothetical protein EOJ36_08705 [Sandaracinomonas limnophila]